MATLKTLARQGLNSFLDPLGLQLVRMAHDWDDAEQFIPFDETIEAARSAGLRLGDYIDAVHNVPGATQETIEKIAALGVFGSKIDRVCEIGPGSGRYLEKTLEACHPSHYEIYETATRWAQYLAEEYRVTRRLTDSRSLSHTDSESIDLVQAHKVFVCTPFVTTCHYYQEMVRVLRPGGWAVFDTLTEACLDEDTLARWMAKSISRSPYPAPVPKLFTVNAFQKRGVSFVGSFVVPMKPGKTECMVFRKTPLSGHDADQASAVR